MLGFYCCTDKIIRIMFIVTVSVIRSSTNHNWAHCHLHTPPPSVHSVTQSSWYTEHKIVLWAWSLASNSAVFAAIMIYAQCCITSVYYKHVASVSRVYIRVAQFTHASNNLPRRRVLWPSAYHKYKILPTAPRPALLLCSLYVSYGRKLVCLTKGKRRCKLPHLSCGLCRLCIIGINNASTPCVKL